MHSLFWEVGVRLIWASTQVRASRRSYSAGNHQINIPPAACWGRIIHAVFCKMVFLCIHTAALWTLLCTLHNGDVNMKQNLQVEPVMVAFISLWGTLYGINMQHRELDSNIWAAQEETLSVLSFQRWSLGFTPRSGDHAPQTSCRNSFCDLKASDVFLTRPFSGLFGWDASK